MPTSASWPGVTLGKAAATVVLLTREGGSEEFGFASRFRQKIWEHAGNGAESGAEDCGGGIRNIGRSSGEQIGQSRISARADSGGKW